MSTPKDSEAAHAYQSELLHDAQDATEKDHQLTVLQAIKLYPKAVFWSAVVSASCLMDGYDLKLIGLLFAQPQFNKAYGKLQPNGKYQISAAWQREWTSVSELPS
jgi:MFS transporter, SP family, general alpha glucoside:H+ symporter